MCKERGVFVVAIAYDMTRMTAIAARYQHRLSLFGSPHGVYARDCQICPADVKIPEVP